jgi:hypothetical protein
MRMIMTVNFPVDRFNAAVRDGSAGPKLQRILEEQKPEAAYFTEQMGQRGAILVVDVPEPSAVPRFAEPWYLGFEADCEFRVAMTAEDVGKAGLEDLGKKWG